MDVNFEIEDNSAVQFQGRHIDLHNNFELVEIRNLQNQIEIGWIFNVGPNSPNVLQSQRVIDVE